MSVLRTESTNLHLEDLDSTSSNARISMTLETDMDIDDATKVRASLAGDEQQDVGQS